MYKVIFKGDIPDIYIDMARGSQLADDFENGMLPERVSIEGTIVDSKSIKAVISNVGDPERKEKKDDFMEMVDKINKNHRDMKRTLLNTPIEERAKRLEIAEMLSIGIRGRKLAENEREAIVERQTAWLEENPEWSEANPICYRDIIDQPIQPTGVDTASHISQIVGMNSMRLAEMQVQNGIKNKYDV